MMFTGGRITRRRFAAGVMFAVAFALAVGGSRAGSAADKFLDALDDVPLMPGLVELDDRGVAFESASGRIVEAAAAGRRTARLTPEAVEAFYHETLPALGWMALGSGRFARGGETLVIAAGQEADRVLVRFSVTPK